MEKNRLSRFLSQSDLGVAAFEGESGILIFQNVAFTSLFPQSAIRHFSDFEASISWQQPLPRTVGQVFLNNKGTEHYGSTVAETSEQVWLWAHCQPMRYSNGEVDAVLVLIYKYYTGLPPLSLNDPTGITKVREFLSHDLNSTFMSLHLAIENADVGAELKAQLMSIVRAAENRRDSTLKMVVPLFDLHELDPPPDTPSGGLLRQTSAASELKRKIRLLVVEDDTELLGMIASGMQARDYEVAATSSLDSALQVVTEGFIPDTALIDLRLGNQDGRVVAQQLQVMLPNLDIIFMTGFANWAAIASLESLGRVLRKPFSLELLSSAILESFGETA